MGKGSTLQLVSLALLGIACCAAPVYADSLDELTPYLSAQYFTWREFQGGKQLLKESGALFAGGVVVEYLPAAQSAVSLALRGRSELFGGVVNYDGETIGPNPVPLQTDVTYFGTRQELDLGCRYSAGNWMLEPFGGAGHRWWIRDLQGGSGYTEYWQTLYLRAGARGSYRPDPELSFFAEGGAKRPWYTGNSIDFAGTGWTTFHPGAQWSGFGELGARYQHLKLGLSYEGFRFSASPVRQVGTGRFLQPNSTSDLIGLNLGWSF